MMRVDVTLTRKDYALTAAFETRARILALHGPSGAGKSTLASLIAGLVKPARGRIELDGTVLLDTERRLFLPPEKRRIGVVFQDALLFPHLSVRQNILFGRYFTPPAERRAPVDAIIETLGVGHLLDRRPVTLSGGERQRVGLARALCASPRLLVMDEPMAALDHARRMEVMGLIERLRDEFSIPMALVSHSADEIMRLADEVIVLDHGRIVAQGPPNAALPGAARRIEGGRFALTSFLTTQPADYDARYGVTTLAHPAGEIFIPAKIASRDRPLRVEVKATQVTIALDLPERMSTRTVLRGQVKAIDADAGPLAFVTLALAGGEYLVVAATRLSIDELGLAPGRDVFALVKSVALDERGM
jgi:molybdate transport system ATP-binding protein